MKNGTNIRIKLMHTTQRTLNFFNAIAQTLTRRDYAHNIQVEFLNTAEILYIRRQTKTKAGFYCMHIRFVSGHTLCIAFGTRTEYEDVLRKINAA